MVIGVFVSTVPSVVRHTSLSSPSVSVILVSTTETPTSTTHMKKSTDSWSKDDKYGEGGILKFVSLQDKMCELTQAINQENQLL